MVKGKKVYGVKVVEKQYIQQMEWQYSGWNSRQRNVTEAIKYMHAIGYTLPIWSDASEEKRNNNRTKNRTHTNKSEINANTKNHHKTPFQRNSPRKYENENDVKNSEQKIRYEKVTHM